MFEVTRLAVGQLKANCYIVSEGSSSVVIDPGDDADYIIRKLTDKRLAPQGILVTHGHFDHLMAATELKLAYGIPFYMNPSDNFLLERLESSAMHFLRVKADPPPIVDFPLKEESEITLGKLKLQVLETPGHTPGSVSFYCEEKESIFVGDLVFEGGAVGRTDFSYGDKEILFNSLNRILKLPSKTKVYSGHGELTTTSSLKKFFDN